MAPTALGADQRDVVAFLSTAAAYPSRGAGDDVQRIDTHISIVWLAGDRAYKLKRDVRFDYVDFSTIDRRRAACDAEVRLNRRTAPGLYVGVVPVTREPDGSLTIDGRGTPVDWLVVMSRFDEDSLFDRLAERGRLELRFMEGLAAAIADLHAIAEPRTDHGGYAGMAWVIDGNARGFAEQGAGVLGAPACERLTAASRAAAARHRNLLDARRRGGHVRVCHGDLHLRNICLIDGRPTLFDGVEFNDEIACVDVLYDAAFLWMDLWRRDLAAHANLVFNAYVSRTLDVEGLPLLPLFLACRAAVRAKTSLSSAAVQPDSLRAREQWEAARRYLTLAQTFLAPPPPRLVAVGGFSGSGKSTLARDLAPSIGAAPGAVILRSDLIRKALCGVDPLTRLTDAAYTPEISRRVYDTIAGRARAVLRGGHAAIADAVYAGAPERAAIEAVARDAGVPFAGVWLDAPPERLASRLRERKDDASDATRAVLDRQCRLETGTITWTRCDAAAGAAEMAQEARACLSLTCTGPGGSEAGLLQH